MVKNFYIPERGDLLWLNFDPQEGHEQAGMRPALVMSPKAYHELSGLALVCPVTSKRKGLIFELSVSCKKIQGAVLVDQMRSIDFKSRKVRFIEKVNAKLIQLAQAYMVSLLTQDGL